MVVIASLSGFSVANAATLSGMLPAPAAGKRLIIVVASRVVGATPNVPVVTLGGNAVAMAGSALHVGPGTSRLRTSIFHTATYTPLVDNAIEAVFAGQTQNEILYHSTSATSGLPLVRQFASAEASEPAMSVTPTLPAPSFDLNSRMLAVLLARRSDGGAPAFVDPEAGWGILLDFSEGGTAIQLSSKTSAPDLSVVLGTDDSADLLAVIVEATNGLVSAEIVGVSQPTIALLGRG